MTEQEWLALIGIAELAGFTLLIIIGLMFYMARRKRRDNTAVKHLADKIISNKKQRSAEIEQLLADQFDGDMLADRAKELLQAENQLYQHIIDTYVKRDHEQLAKLDNKIHGLIKPYEAIVSEASAGGSSKKPVQKAAPAAPDEAPQAETAPAPSGGSMSVDDIDIEAEIDAGPDAVDPRLEAIADLSEKVTYMTAKFNRARSELGLYRDTLNRVFFEYTAMFGVDLDPDQKLSASDIVQRLESGRLGDSDDGDL